MSDMEQQFWHLLTKKLSTLPPKNQKRLLTALKEALEEITQAPTRKTLNVPLRSGQRKVAGLFENTKPMEELRKVLNKYGDIRKALENLDGRSLAALPWETLQLLRKRMETEEFEAIKNQVKKRGSLFEQVAKEQLKKLAENPPVTGAHRRSEKAFGRGLPIGTKQKKVPIFTFGMDGVKRVGEQELEDEEA